MFSSIVSNASKARKRQSTTAAIKTHRIASVATSTSAADFAMIDILRATFSAYSNPRSLTLPRRASVYLAKTASAA